MTRESTYQFRGVARDVGDHEFEEFGPFDSLEEAQQTLRDEMDDAERQGLPYDQGWVEFREQAPWRHISSYSVPAGQKQGDSDA